MNTNPSDDILITGAGPAGLALAIALTHQGLRCTVLEQAPLAALAEPAEDGRDIALTHRARDILTQLGLWQRLPAEAIAPLCKASVRNGDSPHRLDFDARSQGHEALGWLVPNHLIRRACWEAAQAAGVRIEGDAQVVGLTRDASSATLRLANGEQRRARLVVAADSRHSTLRRMAGIGARTLDFGRTAIVCRMAHTAEHHGIAHEGFLWQHTLAMLPLAGRESSAVLTVPTPDAAAWLAMPADEFASNIASQFGPVLGEMRLQGQRHAYPLVAVYAQRFCAERFALIGDAAVGMHPVTAHGFNFDLYGVEELARELAAAQAAGRDPGDARALQAYADRHRRATLPIYLGTNLVVQLFTDDRAPARLAREAIVRVSNWLPPVKGAVIRQLTGQRLESPLAALKAMAAGR